VLSLVDSTRVCYFFLASSGCYRVARFVLFTNLERACGLVLWFSTICMLSSLGVTQVLGDGSRLLLLTCISLPSRILTRNHCDNTLKVFRGTIWIASLNVDFSENNFSIQHIHLLTNWIVQIVIMAWQDRANSGGTIDNTHTRNNKKQILANSLAI
jgi:hypothetical protein